MQLPRRDNDARRFMTSEKCRVDGVDRVPCRDIRDVDAAEDDVLLRASGSKQDPLDVVERVARLLLDAAAYTEENTVIRITPYAIGMDGTEYRGRTIELDGDVCADNGTTLFAKGE